MSDERFRGKDPSNYDFEHLLYDKDGYIATLTLNRPEKYNCLNYTLLTEIVEASRDAAFDDEIAVVVVTGAGDEAFCTGADLNEQQQFLNRPQDYWKWMSAFIDMHYWLRNIGKPTIARINGIVVGGGNEVNIACDLAIAAEDATLRQIGASNGSVAAGGATQWMPLVVGDRRAREILFLNEEISAEQALDWGWVNRVVPREELDEAVETMAAKLYDKLPECVRYTKQHLNFWREFSESLTVQHARDWLSIHNMSPETREAVTAFNNKREPDVEKLRGMYTEDKFPYDWEPEDYEG